MNYIAYTTHPIQHNVSIIYTLLYYCATYYNLIILLMRYTYNLITLLMNHRRNPFDGVHLHQCYSIY